MNDRDIIRDMKEKSGNTKLQEAYKIHEVTYFVSNNISYK